VQQLEASQLSVVGLILLAVVGGIILISVNVIFDASKTTTSTITSNGSPTFSIFDGNLTFVVDNNVLRIYGLDHKAQFTFSASRFTGDNSARFISPQSISFTPPIIQHLSEQLPTNVTVSIKNQSGLYQGAFFITSKKGTSIPITIDIKPTANRVIIWVINGIAIAVLFSKLAKFAIYKRARGVRVYLQAEGITSTETIVKNAFLDVASISFAAIISLLGLQNDALFNAVHSLDLPSIGVLIMIGLGIGGFKEYLNSVSSR
jgi:hypothetical protein